MQVWSNRGAATSGRTQCVARQNDDDATHGADLVHVRNHAAIHQFPQYWAARALQSETLLQIREVHYRDMRNEVEVQTEKREVSARHARRLSQQRTDLGLLDPLEVEGVGLVIPTASRKAREP